MRIIHFKDTAMKVIRFGNDYAQQQIAAGNVKAARQSVVNIEDYGRVQPEEAKVVEPVVEGREVDGGEKTTKAEAKKKGKDKGKA